MTVTVYIASFVGADGKAFHGSIFWDKYSPRRLVANLCPHISPLEVDYPVWKLTASHTRSGLEKLRLKMKGKASKMHLTLVSEGETKFAVQ